ncbi:uncharacterized protein HaLaN_29719, partial [Haematococcus lacustris]
MEPVAAWVRGVRFMDLTKMTSIFEGSLVRAVRRLEELMRQMAEALAGVEAQAALRSLLSGPKLILPFLQPGRLVRVLPSAFNPQAPLPDFGSLPGLAPADGAGPDEWRSGALLPWRVGCSGEL